LVSKRKEEEQGLLEKKNLLTKRNIETQKLKEKDGEKR